jgi:predicted PurR-regulated permease PerM
MFDTMGGYVRARGLTALIVAATIWLGLFLLGIENNTTLALLAGLGDLIPFVGPPLAIIPALVVALLDSPAKAALVLGLYLVVQQVKSHLLSPLLMRHQASIPPLVVVFALVVGSSVGGVIGTLVATPLAGALRVLVLRVIAPALRRRLREDDFGPVPAA